MKQLDITSADIETLISAYRSSAFEHGAATERGDHRAANRHHDVIAAIYAELRRRGYEAQAALLPLLDDISPSVRAWAAAHALEFAPSHGEIVLQRLAKQPGVIGFNADMTLKEWRNGSLHFP